MSFVDSFTDFLTPASTRKANAGADDAETAAAKNKLEYAKTLAAQAAQSLALGGPDGQKDTNGNLINWSPAQGPSGNITLLGGDPGAQPDQTMNPGMRYAGSMTLPGALLGGSQTQPGQGPITPSAAGPSDTPMLMGGGQRATQPPMDPGASGNTTPLLGRQPVTPAPQLLGTTSVAPAKPALLNTDAIPSSITDAAAQAAAAPAAFAKQQAMWRAQANPQAYMANQAALASQQAKVDAINASSLPDAAKKSAIADAMGLTETAKSLAKNNEMPDSVKELHANLADLNAAQPGTPEYAVAKAKIDLATQNMPLANLQETHLKNMLDASNSNLVMGTMPDGLTPAIIDRRGAIAHPISAAPGATTGTVAPIVPGGMPATGLPAPGAPYPVATPPAATPSPVNPAAATAPAASNNGTTLPAATSIPPVAPPAPGEFVPQLSPEIEKRIQGYPAAYQGTLRAMLTGRMPAPTGTAMKDPVFGPLLRAAETIDPSFDQTKWANRNKIVTGMASTEANSLGGRIDSAKKLINHSANLLDASAELNNTMPLGRLGNAAPNWMTTNTGSGPGKTALNRFDSAAEGVVEERLKTLSGAAGAEGSKEKGRDLFNPNDPLNGHIGSVGDTVDLMNGQVEPLIDQYNGSMGTHATLEQILGPATAAKMRAIQSLSASAKTGTVAPRDVKSAMSKVIMPPGMKQYLGTKNGVPVYLGEDGKKYGGK